MRRYTTGEIQQHASHTVQTWLATHSLDNARKIAREVRRLLLEEVKRREKIEN
jgi:hypothetical protein